MFAERTILYFTPFYFKNGNKAKNKYFIVIKNIGDKCILASLPSSKDYVPSHLAVNNGCIESPEANFNCFVFSPTTAVTECGKSFSVPTYLYGHLLDDYDISFLEDLYSKEATDYQVWGTMLLDLYNQLVQCFKNSKSVKRKYKKLL